MEVQLAVTTQALTKRFGNVVAVDGLDLEVPRGGVFGLLGPSGAGKSTTLRLLAGRARATSGSATVAGAPVSFENGSDLRRRIGVLDERPGFYGWMTGRELVAFAADLGGVARAELPIRVERTLEQIGLLAAAGERIAGYSDAMRQRLGIGQALVGEPEILLLDDPLGSLDPGPRRDVIALLRELGGRATVVMSTAQPADAEAACARVAILHRGRLAISGRVEDLRRERGSLEDAVGQLVDPPAGEEPSSP